MPETEQTLYSAERPAFLSAVFEDFYKAENPATSPSSRRTRTIRGQTQGVIFKIIAKNRDSDKFNVTNI